MCFSYNTDRLLLFITFSTVLKLMLYIHVNQYVVIGTFLWSGSVDYTIRVWDLSTGKCAATLSALGGGSGHTDAVTCMEYIPNMGGEPLIASGSADRTVKIWNPNGGALHHTCTHSSVVTALKAFRDTHGGNNRSFFEFYLLFIQTYIV